MRALLLLSVAVGGCGEVPPIDVETAANEQAIFGGRSESGFNAVGALVLELPQHGYVGSFCSGTLVAPTWVLTAAHCVTGPAQLAAGAGPTDIRFFVGADARPPVEGQRPASGAFHAVARAFVHPSYREPGFGLDDIALLQLAAPVQGVTPIRMHAAAAPAGGSLLYVGFGVSDGVAQTGAGVKRSTNARVGRVLGTTYTSEHQGSGVCYGDSGGPGLVAVGGAYEVVGVNSKAAGNGAVGDCALASLQTRVDAYATWVGSVMGAGVSCLDDPGVCACAGACGADGVCDNLECGSGTGCAEIANCSATCGADPFCPVDCYGDGYPGARAAFDGLVGCAEAECAQAADQSSCLESRCAADVSACFEAPPPPPTGEGSCTDVLDCVATCQDDACYRRCTATGTPEAVSNLEALLVCAADRCADQAADADAYTDCSYTACDPEWGRCLDREPEPEPESTPPPEPESPPPAAEPAPESPADDGPACAPLPEACNGVEDNCDGVVDEGCVRISHTAKVVGAHASSCSSSGTGAGWWCFLLLAVRRRR